MYLKVFQFFSNTIANSFHFKIANAIAFKKYLHLSPMSDLDRQMNHISLQLAILTFC